jgi:hypothetical protein
MVVRVDGAPGAQEYQLPLAPPLKYHTDVMLGMMGARMLLILVLVGHIGSEIRFQPWYRVMFAVSTAQVAAVMVNTALLWSVAVKPAGSMAVILIKHDVETLSATAHEYEQPQLAHCVWLLRLAMVAQLVPPFQLSSIR